MCTWCASFLLLLLGGLVQRPDLALSTFSCCCTEEHFGYFQTSCECVGQCWINGRTDGWWRFLSESDGAKCRGRAVRSYV